MGLLIPKYSTTAVVFFLCYFSAIVCGKKLRTFSQNYGPFNETHFSIFEVEKPATISNDALQVTPDSASADFDLRNHSGRILYRQPFKLWDGEIASSEKTKNSTVAGAAVAIASFNTSFLINIYRPQNETAGEGLAFLIAADLDLPPNSYGGYLGLANSTTDGNTSNHLVAVELDTSRQQFDPDDNHIGIDINGVRSVKTVSLTPHNITLAPKGPKFYNIWIDYDGVSKLLEVFIAEQDEKTGPTPPKPTTSIISANLDLQNYLKEYSYFGFSASTGNGTQLNCILRWNLTIHFFPEDKSQWLKITLGSGVPIMVLIIMGLVGFGYYSRKRQIPHSNSNLAGALKILPGTPREFKFKDLKRATNNFDEKTKLGQGGYGVVYKGFLAKENLDIAVKQFSRESIKGEDDFLAELTIINRLRHKHLVKLLGWCYKNGKLLLVYEYMPNGSLDKHLFSEPDVEPLEWSLRYNIVAGVASALHYLHNEFEQRVVHRDLKASNIMLDSNFSPRLGDFGLARALDNEKTSYAEADGVLGTMGYIAPECFHTGKATQQSDVFAFGAILLEVVCGLRPGSKIAGFQLLVDWVWFLHRDGRLLEAVDPILGENFVAEEAERLLLLGLSCSHPTAGERPKTQTILQMISGTVSVPYVPPFKPAFVWPAGGPVGLNLDLSSSTGSLTMTTSHFGSSWSPHDLSRENDTYSLV